MNPCILVPVDFTSVSFNAYHHANNLAYRLGYDLLLVHVLSGYTSVSKFLEQRPGQSLEDSLLNRLKSFSNWHPNEPVAKFFPINTTCNLLEGNILSQMLNLAKDPAIEMIVVGTREHHHLRERWLGSISQGLSQQAVCPVLLVPGESHFKAYKKIVVASDYHANDFYVLEQFMAFNKVFKGETHFVHIGEKDDAYYFHEGEIQAAMTVYGQPDYGIEMVTLSGSDVISGIYDYAAVTNADLMVFVSEKRPLLEALTHRSVTKKAALDCQIPSLIYHATT